MGALFDDKGKFRAGGRLSDGDLIKSRGIEPMGRLN